MGLYRLGLIAVAMACLQGQRKDAEWDAAVFLREAKFALPDAVALAEQDDGFFPVLDASEQLLGYAVSTAPQARSVQGYAGPSELMVIFDAARRVKRVSFLQSADTAGHVEKVRRDEKFWSQWDGKPEASLSSGETPLLVSGASLTSEAMARGLAARFGAVGMEEFFPQDFSLDQVKQLFPQASSFHALPRLGTYEVRQGDAVLGTLLRSARMHVAARGFNGSSDVLLGLNADGTMLQGVLLLASRDNEPYVGDVKDELLYTQGFAGRTVDAVLQAQEASDFLLVSGASTTARSVMATVQEMLRRYQTKEELSSWSWQLPASLLWIVLGVWVGFRGPKSSRWWYALLSVAAGLSVGLMVGQDQLIGWARHGIDWRPALPLLALTAVALLVPALTGKNVYCSQICPHGAAQRLAGMAVKKRFALSAKWHRFFSTVPWISLLFIWGLALWGSGLPFAHAEPFEVWSTGFIALMPALIFTGGILVSFFLPQGYCHYGCPTGAMLKFLTHAPGRWTNRDWFATIFIVLAVLWVMI